MPGYRTFADTCAYASGVGLASLSAAALVGAFNGVWLAVPSLLALVSYQRRIHLPRQEFAPTLVLALFALLALTVGILQFADLPAPLWVDSYRHAADIHHILTHGHAPPAQVYHFGFHHLVVWLVQLADTAIPAAMILAGQFIVVQIGLSFFAFGARWTQSRVVGFASALGVWFLTPTPMYFLTWGRYPLLLGIAILPIALIAALDWLDAPRDDARALFIALVTLAGLASAHLRLLAFYVLFVMLYSIWRGIPARRLMALALPLLVLGIVGSARWLSQPNGTHNVLAALTFWSGIELTTAFRILTSHYGVMAWCLAMGGLGLAILQRNASLCAIVAWFGTLTVGAMLFTAIGVPLVEIPFVLLMGFFPAALLMGNLAHWAFSKARWLVSLVGIVIALLGAREMLTIFNPITILFTRADARAMQWIVTHTPPDARFLVNTFEWYPHTFVPTDGGAWIPYFTRRAIVTDPASPFTHVYLGQRQGIWHASDFADPTRYVLMYAQDGVMIWQVK